MPRKREEVFCAVCVNQASGSDWLCFKPVTTKHFMKTLKRWCHRCNLWYSNPDDIKAEKFREAPYTERDLIGASRGLCTGKDGEDWTIPHNCAITILNFVEELEERRKGTNDK